MKLLEPIKLGNLTLKNRVMFPPLTTGYEERDGSIGEHSLNFYKRLAQGGVSYVVIGDVAPVRTVSPTPKLFDDSQIPTFKKLADALHEYDCKVALQLFHPEYDVPGVGRLIGMSMMLNKEAQMAKAAGNEELFAAKSAEAQKVTRDAYAKLHHDMLHFVSEATKEQLDSIKNLLAQSARRAMEAGIDAIEVHGDRLLGSLCSTILNHRTDEYGGAFENRIRYALEVVTAIKEAAPSLMIEYKLPIVTVQEDGSLMGKGGIILEEAIEFAKILEQHGVDTIHVAQANHTGNMNDTIPAMGTRPYAFMKEHAKAIKDVVSIPVSIVGRVLDVNMAEELINEGICDFVAFGRPLLCDPDIVNKLEAGQAHLIRNCIMCNKGCTDNIQNRKFLACVLNPENGYEYKRIITPANESKNIAIIGGGVAGLEAARVAAIKGHKVTVFEKTDKLYGQINIASVPPRKDEMLRICKYYDEIINEYNINVVLNHEFVKEEANNYDDVIVAVGAVNAHPRIPGIENAIDSWDILAEKAKVNGNVIVAGGGLVGVETSEYLLKQGCNITIVEMTDKIAREESSTILPTILKEFKLHNVVTLTNHKILEIGSNFVKVAVLDKDGNTTEIKTVEGDYVVNALASSKVRIDLEGVKANVHYVGDCKDGAPCNLDNATKSAYDVANSI
ncbi:MAG: FAD-dependent oxidoreductase [Bacilli bacterium]|nr:FAD-dependent oxidoreductase [Bacilli bacterium]